MQTLILCGGQGTRLREETEYRPKPLIEVGGRPILWHIMKTYSHYGFNDFILCLGYRGQMIKDYFLRYEAMNQDFTIHTGRESKVEFHGQEMDQYKVTLAETGMSTMTGGRVQQASKYIDGDTFMLTYGDGLANVNVSDLLKFHQAHGKLATVTTMRPMSRFGELDIESSGLVKQFVEKPQRDAWASCGFFVLDRKVLELLDGDQCTFEKEPLERLVADNQLVAYQHDGFFFAMDTFREYQQINRMWDEGDTPWKVW